MNLRKPCRACLKLEVLEERVLLDATIIEDFKSGGLSAYSTILRFNSSARVARLAAHDDRLGLLDTDGDDWIARNDADVQVAQGQTVSTWVKFANAADGRAYFGFGANLPQVNKPLSTGATLSIVLAPNTNELLLQQNGGFKFQSANSNAGTKLLGPVPQQYLPDHWQ